MRDSIASLSAETAAPDAVVLTADPLTARLLNQQLIAVKSLAVTLTPAPDAGGTTVQSKMRQEVIVREAPFETLTAPEVQPRMENPMI
jgi:hypothetical protein